MRQWHTFLPPITISCGRCPRETADTWEWYIKDTDRRTLPLTADLVRLLVEFQMSQPGGNPYVFVPMARYEHIQELRRTGRWTVEKGCSPLSKFCHHFNKIRARAGTANLHIRCGQMTMALLAQAAIHQLRTRLGEPVCGGDANHLAKDFFRGLEGDVRVQEDTIIVTYYNVPHEVQLRAHYENPPHQLRAQNINPQVPWLYGFKLDFRFR